MKNLHEKIFSLVDSGNVRISEHGYDELADDDIILRDILGSIAESGLVEEYIDFPKGPCILVLQEDSSDKPVHVVWGIPKGYDEPAVLVTAYRPDPGKWDRTFRRRKG